MFREISNTDGTVCPRGHGVARCLHYDGIGEYGLQMEPAELYYECADPNCGVHFYATGQVFYAPHDPVSELTEEELCLILF